MSHQCPPRRDEAVDRVRTIYWFQYLAQRVGSFQPRDVQRAIFPIPATDAHGGPVKNNKFLGYSRGEHVPHVALVHHATVKYPESARILNHVIWKVLRESRPVEKYARSWVGQLAPDLQKAVVQTDNQIGENSRTSDMLVRRFSLDSLAALTILFRLNREANKIGPAWIYACEIFRTLMLMEPQFVTEELSTLVFRLFDSRVFSLVSSFGGVRFNLETFNYPEKALLLRRKAMNFQYFDEIQGVQVKGIYIRSPLRKRELSRLMEIIDLPVVHEKVNNEQEAINQKEFMK